MLKTLILNLVLLLGTVGTVEGQKYGGGTGEPNDPYLIYDANHMQAIGAHPNDWDKHFVLTNDIDLSYYDGKDNRPAFNIIGYGWCCVWGDPFMGVFDGAGHSIANFTWDSNTVDNVGIFGYVRSRSRLRPTAEIRNLTLVDPNVNAEDRAFVGAVVGYLQSGIIANCHVTGGKVCGGYFVGGLLGRGLSSYERRVVRECSSSATVSGTDYVGGLIGQYLSVKGHASVENSYANGDVFGTASYTGGLVGYLDGEIANSFYVGNVSGTGYVGGLVGSASGSRYGGITNCYSSGRVSGDYCVGGLCGFNSTLLMFCYSSCLVEGHGGTGGLVALNRGRSHKCYWDIEASGQTTSEAGVGKSTSEMMKAESFLAWGTCDNAGIWSLDEKRDYPRLWFENKRGRPISVQMSKFIPGEGTACDPYLITSAKQLNVIGLFPCHWDEHFKLTADIDLAGFSGTEFNIIGFYEGEYDNDAFTGVFDGCGHTISNFTYTGVDRDYVGLFGYVAGRQAVIKNLGLVDPNVVAGVGGALVYLLTEGTLANCWVMGGSVSGLDGAGGLAGGFRDAYVTGCYVQGTTVSSEGSAGGLASGNGPNMIGTEQRGLIEECDTNCTVQGYSGVGGLVGSNWGKICRSSAAGQVAGHDGVGGLAGSNRHGGTIWSCYANCDVNAAGGGAGGLVGGNYSWSEIFDSHAMGSVSGDSRCGGLIGSNIYGGKVYRCYSWTRVSGNTHLGGLVGYSDDEGTVVDDSFWDVEASGLSTSAGGTGLTTREMQDANTFLNAGWDFVGEFENGPSDEWAQAQSEGYPVLWWQLDPPPPLPEFAGGSGTKSDPYLISNADDVSRIGHNSRLMKSYFRMTDDINLSDVNLVLIGNVRDAFVGTFDGNDKTISNLLIDANGADFKGLFEYVDSPDAEIRDLGLRHADVNTRNNVGSLVGYLRQGTIAGCFAEQSRISGHWYVGGLIGRSEGLIKDCCFSGDVFATGEHTGGLVGYSRGEIFDSYSSGNVSGYWYVGGLVGENDGQGAVFNCYFDGNVEGTSSVGGLAGSTYHESTTSDCYSQGSVLGQRVVGGLIGKDGGSTWQSYSHASIQGLDAVGGLLGIGRDISRCYSTGRVIGTGDNVGGLIGRWDGREATASFWDTQTSGLMDSDGGTGLTTAEMQTMSTYADAGWDFNTPMWTIDEGHDYPRLWWEFLGPPIECKMRFTPRVLNLGSQGKWVRAHLVLPEGYTIEDVDVDSPLIIRPMGIEAQYVNVFVNDEDLVEIKATFGRTGFCSSGPFGGTVTVDSVLASGQPFYGTATINVIDKSLEQMASLASYWLRADCAASDWCDGLDLNRDSVVNFADFALFNGCCIEIVAQ